VGAAVVVESVVREAMDCLHNSRSSNNTGMVGVGPLETVVVVGAEEAVAEVVEAEVVVVVE
jgi:hypothetical protein